MTPRAGHAWVPGREVKCAADGRILLQVRIEESYSIYIRVSDFVFGVNRAPVPNPCLPTP